MALCEDQLWGGFACGGHLLGRDPAGAGQREEGRAGVVGEGTGQWRGAPEARRAWVTPV